MADGKCEGEFGSLLAGRAGITERKLVLSLLVGFRRCRIDFNFRLCVAVTSTVYNRSRKLKKSQHSRATKNPCSILSVTVTQAGSCSRSETTYCASKLELEIVTAASAFLCRRHRARDQTVSFVVRDSERW